MSTIHSWSQIQSQLKHPDNPVVFLGREWYFIVIDKKKTSLMCTCKQIVK